MKEILLLTLILLSGVVFAQKKSITVSGVVMDADTVITLPYVNIRLKGTNFGTVSDITGRFNFTASEGDTLRFSSVGYFDAFFIMPEQLEGNRYSLIQLMRKETIMLEEVVIFPWPEYSQLKEALINTIPKRNFDDISFEAQRKIARISEEEYERNRHYYNVYHNNQLYDMTGIVPANNFLNPFNWSNFIRDVKLKKYIKEKK